MATKQQITNDLQNYMANIGGNWSDWYVGITADPKARLFNDHAVMEKGGQWIYRLCASSTEAREVEDYFVAKGTKGGPGGGDNTTKSVYAYKITSSTTE